MDEIIFIIQESAECGYEAKALDFPIFTEADSIDELKLMVKDAVDCHFEKGTKPKIIRFNFVRN